MFYEKYTVNVFLSKVSLAVNVGITSKETNQLMTHISDDLMVWLLIHGWVCKVVLCMCMPGPFLDYLGYSEPLHYPLGINHW